MTLYGIYVKTSGLYITALTANSSTEAVKEFKQGQHNLPEQLRSIDVVAREMQLTK